MTIDPFDLEQILVEIEQLKTDFGRLFLADVQLHIETERKQFPSRSQVHRAVPRIPKLTCDMPIRVKCSVGLEMRLLSPQTYDEFAQAELFYNIDGKPVANSLGQSLVFEPGWRSNHTCEFYGVHATQAFEAIERANDFACRHARIWAPLLFSGRSLSLSGWIWPDVVLQIASIGDQSTLREPEWKIVVGGAIWSVEAWKGRQTLPKGFFPLDVPAEEVERIGAIPEVYFVRRSTYIRDSEIALDWLLRQVKTELVRAQTESAKTLAIGTAPIESRKVSTDERATAIESLPKSQRLAYLAFLYAELKMGRTLTDPEAWNYLHEFGLEGSDGLEDYKLPFQDTFADYNNRARRALGSLKTQPRGGRKGRSVIRQSEF